MDRSRLAHEPEEASQSEQLDAAFEQMDPTGMLEVNELRSQCRSMIAAGDRPFSPGWDQAARDWATARLTDMLDKLNALRERVHRVDGIRLKVDGSPGNTKEDYATEVLEAKRVWDETFQEWWALRSAVRAPYPPLELMQEDAGDAEEVQDEDAPKGAA